MDINDLILKEKTPFYLYNIDILSHNLSNLCKEANKYNYKIHYAIKANCNPRILKEIIKYRLGADCVSGNEIKLALDSGFKAESVVYAGIGKTDEEITYALRSNILCFNCESEEEIYVINKIAKIENKIASIAIRINPNINAHTHTKITTGTLDNKFGISIYIFKKILNKLTELSNIKLIGLHFHIGSQIRNLKIYEQLCNTINQLQDYIDKKNIFLKEINIGGGLGIDYHNPKENKFTDFKSFFSLINQNIKLRKYQNLHFELGRSIVGQCGSLISKVLYTKENEYKKFIIIDAGMTDLLRPALYDAYHKIENINSKEDSEIYDIVGPICESSDCFGKAIELNKTKRGDFMDHRQFLGLFKFRFIIMIIIMRIFLLI
ncbi:MAG: diaminopimelate decarboxylase [Marinifilaceae bacterium]|jgi:diaminopimelate decarboxylase|nr:diaminopimelate decarboxylase [Marinifilaceae bacterium]